MKGVAGCLPVSHCVLAAGNEQLAPLFVVGNALLISDFPFSFILPFLLGLCGCRFGRLHVCSEEGGDCAFDVCVFFWCL